MTANDIKEKLNIEVINYLATFKPLGSDWVYKDYADDLNAMRFAELFLFELPDGYTQKYINAISKIKIEEGYKGWSRAIDNCTFATAEEKAKAFVRVMMEYTDVILKIKKGRKENVKNIVE